MNEISLRPMTLASFAFAKFTPTELRLFNCTNNPPLITFIISR